LHFPLYIYYLPINKENKEPEETLAVASCRIKQFQSATRSHADSLLNSRSQLFLIAFGGLCFFSFVGDGDVEITKCVGVWECGTKVWDRTACFPIRLLAINQHN
jgi:hypothetical protein